MLLARAAAALRPPRDLDGEADLPAIVDPAVGLVRSVEVLSIVTLAIVALTSPTRVGAGYTLSDIGALLVLYAIGTFALSRLPWDRLPSTAAVAIVGAQLLFVVSLTTVTGGGRSPYFVLYAPILALAGWHLRRDWVVLTVAAVAIIEWWRAMVLEGGQGTASQLVVALPLFAAIAALAHITAERLLTAIVTIRRDQVRTAETLAAIQRLASTPVGDPLVVASEAAERIFESRARIVRVDPPAAPSAVPDLVARSESGRRLSVGVTGSTGTHAILELERAEPFSVTEVRLAGMLGGTAGQAVDRHRGRGAHL